MKTDSKGMTRRTFLAVSFAHRDAHRPEFGPVGGPGNLAFIEAGSLLRPGHGIFNEF